MESIIQKISQKYGADLAHIENVGTAEISIRLKNDVNSTDFTQKLKDNLVDIIDDLSIVKINIFDTNGSSIESFSTNQ